MFSLFGSLFTEFDPDSDVALKLEPAYNNKFNVCPAHKYAMDCCRMLRERAVWASVNR
jgi:hypothetical protein